MLLKGESINKPKLANLIDQLVWFGIAADKDRALPIIPSPTPVRRRDYPYKFYVGIHLALGPIYPTPLWICNQIFMGHMMAIALAYT